MNHGSCVMVTSLWKLSAVSETEPPFGFGDMIGFLGGFSCSFSAAVGTFHSSPFQSVEVLAVATNFCAFSVDVPDLILGRGSSSSSAGAVTLGDSVARG